MDPDNEKNTIKLLCWFWEYRNYDDLSKFIFTIAKTTKYIKIKNMMVLFLNLYINNKSEESKVLDKCLKSNSYNPSLLESCNQRLKETKKQKFFYNLSIYDILNMNYQSLANLICDKNIIYNLSKFQIVTKNRKCLNCTEIVIQEKISLAIERGLFLNAMSNFLQEVISPVLLKIQYTSLPVNIITNIISFLDPRELKEIAINLIISEFDI